MKVLVGLGNPGEKYQRNRHNIGFMVVDKVARALGVTNYESKFESLVAKTESVFLVKPQTFMNKSGVAVSEVVNFYKVGVENLIVVHDDLDIRIGEYKIQNGIGPKVHNGINSIENALGNKNFWRVRIGVDNRPSREFRTPGDEYVLEDFIEEEMKTINEVTDRVITELRKML